MTKGAIAVIGGGNMGRAILDGLISRGTPPGSIALVEILAQRRSQVAGETKVRGFERIDRETGSSECVILAVKPQTIGSVLKELDSFLTEEQLLISVAAGISIGFMEKRLGRPFPIVRCMPNIAAKVGKSAVAMCAGKSVSSGQRELAGKVLAGIGEVIEVEESQIDAVTGLSGSGPAFVFLMIEALADGGVLVGLPRDKALELAVLTVEGAVALLRELKTPPAAAREMVTSPGGTTIEGLLELEEGGFRGLVMKAVQRAAEKSRTIGAVYSE